MDTGPSLKKQINSHFSINKFDQSQLLWPCFCRWGKSCRPVFKLEPIFYVRIELQTWTALSTQEVLLGGQTFETINTSDWWTGRFLGKVRYVLKGMTYGTIWPLTNYVLQRSTCHHLMSLPCSGYVGVDQGVFLAEKILFLGWKGFGQRWVWRHDWFPTFGITGNSQLALKSPLEIVDWR